MEYRASKRDHWSWNGMKTNADIIEVDGNNSFEIIGVKITTTEVPHTIHTQSYRFDADGKSIVVSGDLKYSESLIELAKDADMLIIDSGSIIRVGSNGKGALKSSPDNPRRIAGLALCNPKFYLGISYSQIYMDISSSE